MSSHIPLHMAELEIKRNEVNTSRMFYSDQVGCTSISQAVQLLENNELFAEVLINAAYVQHYK